MSSDSRPRVPRRTPYRIPALRPPVAMATHHEHLEDHHLAIAHQLHEGLAKRVDPTPIAARAQLTRLIDGVERELTGALRQAQILRESLAVKDPVALTQALRLLERAHDDAWRDVQTARNAMLDDQPVDGRIALSRVFRAIGRAEHAHHYVRTSTWRAISAMARAVSASSRRSMVMA